MVVYCVDRKFALCRAGISHAQAGPLLHFMLKGISDLLCFDLHYQMLLLLLIALVSDVPQEERVLAALW